MKFFRHVILWPMAILMGCGANVVPVAPGPKYISNTTTSGTSYTFLKWNDGFAVMLVDRCGKHELTGPNNSNERAWWRGAAHSLDSDSNEWRESYVWELQTTSNGMPFGLKINDAQFYLTNGRVIRIDPNGDDVAVQQFALELARVQPNHASCSDFLAANPELTEAAGE